LNHQISFCFDYSGTSGHWELSKVDDPDQVGKLFTANEWTSFTKNQEFGWRTAGQVFPAGGMLVLVFILRF